MSSPCLSPARSRAGSGAPLHGSGGATPEAVGSYTAAMQHQHVGSYAAHASLCLSREGSVLSERRASVVDGVHHDQPTGAVWDTAQLDDLVQPHVADSANLFDLPIGIPEASREQSTDSSMYPSAGVTSTSSTSSSQISTKSTDTLGVSAAPVANRRSSSLWQKDIILSKLRDLPSSDDLLISEDDLEMLAKIGQGRSSDVWQATWEWDRASERNRKRGAKVKFSNRRGMFLSPPSPHVARTLSRDEIRCVLEAKKLPDLVVEDIPHEELNENEQTRDELTDEEDELTGCRLMNNSIVAVKVPRLYELPSDPVAYEQHERRLVEEFLHELRINFILDESDNRNVQLLGVVLFEKKEGFQGRYGLVLEFMHGGSLFRLLHEKQKDSPYRSQLALEANWLNRLDLTYQLAVAIARMHSLDPAIAHHDLKSPNLLLTSSHDGSNRVLLKVADMGSSRALWDLQQRRMSVVGGNTIGASRSHPQHAYSFGEGLDYSTRWCDPEFLRSRRYRLPQDVYSMGVVIAELAELQLPYGNLDEAKIAELKKQEGHSFSLADPVALQKHQPELYELIMDCCHSDVLKRPSAQQVLIRLDSIFAAARADKGRQFEELQLQLVVDEIPTEYKRKPSAAAVAPDQSNQDSSSVSSDVPPMKSLNAEEEKWWDQNAPRSAPQPIEAFSKQRRSSMVSLQVPFFSQTSLSAIPDATLSFDDIAVTSRSRGLSNPFAPNKGPPSHSQSLSSFLVSFRTYHRAWGYSHPLTVFESGDVDSGEVLKVCTAVQMRQHASIFSEAVAIVLTKTMLIVWKNDAAYKIAAPLLIMQCYNGVARHPKKSRCLCVTGAMGQSHDFEFETQAQADDWLPALEERLKDMPARVKSHYARRRSIVQKQQLNLEVDIQVSKKIGKMLAKEEKHEINIRRYVLVGLPRAGKSTIVRTFRTHYGYPSLTADERRDDQERMRRLCCKCVLEQLYRLVANLSRYGPGASSGSQQALLPQDDALFNAAQWLLSTGPHEPYLVSHVPFVQQLWADPRVQHVYANHRDTLFMSNSLEYFADKFNQLPNPKYVPTANDIARLRIRTDGTIDYRLFIPPSQDAVQESPTSHNTVLTDSGGDLKGRNVVQSMFADVDAVLFVCALDEYDVYDSQDNSEAKGSAAAAASPQRNRTLNRLAQSIEYFKDVAFTRRLVPGKEGALQRMRELDERRRNADFANESLPAKPYPKAPFSGPITSQQRPVENLINSKLGSHLRGFSSASTFIKSAPPSGPVSSMFADKPVILLFNKLDLFRRKLLKEPLEKHFPEFAAFKTEFMRGPISSSQQHALEAVGLDNGTSGSDSKSLENAALAFVAHLFSSAIGTANTAPNVRVYNCTAVNTTEMSQLIQTILLEISLKILEDIL